MKKDRTEKMENKLKSFQFNIKNPLKMKRMMKTFESSIFNNEIIFKSHRNTASQMSKQTFDGITIFNKRKLNELLFVIDNLKDEVKKFEI